MAPLWVTLLNAAWLTVQVLPASVLLAKHSATIGTWKARNTLSVPAKEASHCRSTALQGALTNGLVLVDGKAVPWSNEAPTSWATNDSCELKYRRPSAGSTLTSVSPPPPPRQVGTWRPAQGP